VILGEGKCSGNDGETPLVVCL